MVTLNNLKIISIIVIFLSGWIGAWLPNIISKNINHNMLTLFLLCKIFSAGIILGTGFIHMFPESQNCFTEAYPENDYPFSGLITCVSCVVILVIEQIINFYFNKTNNEELREYHKYESLIEDNNVKINYGLINEEKNNNEYFDSTDISNYQNQNIVNRDNLEHCNTTLEITRNNCHNIDIFNKNKFDIKKLITIYILEFGIAIHSIIIGISLGTIINKTLFVSLFIALSLHQFFEGISLGMNLSKTIKLDHNKIMIIITFFACTTPIGLVIGMLLNNSYNSNSQISLIMEGIFNAISAGVLIYVSLIHLIIEDFNNNEIKFEIKICMFLSLFVGVIITSIIAIWV